MNDNGSKAKKKDRHNVKAFSIVNNEDLTLMFFSSVYGFRSVNRPARIQRPIVGIIYSLLMNAWPFICFGFRRWRFRLFGDFSRRFGRFGNFDERAFEPGDRKGFAGIEVNVGFRTFHAKHVGPRRELG